MTQRKGEKGAVLPLVALMLVILVLLVGLAVDLGHVHNVKIELQRAVDAAALGGAQRLLPDNAIGAIAAASATAKANTIDGTLIGILIDGDPEADPPVPASMPELVITPGKWDTENLTLVDRFAENVTPYNAVQVTATRTVEHFFFFLADPIVSADAIAVKQPEVLTIPLAIISCIPPTGEKTGEFNVCGIKSYTFSSNQNTAGWTSLTIGMPGGASQQEIAEFFAGDGATLFNSVTKMLEDEPIVDPVFLDDATNSFDPAYTGCEGNQGENVICGLGGEFENYLDPGTSDPVERYAAPSEADDAMPRLITLDGVGEEVGEQDAFRDVVTQDGVLAKQDGESDAAFQVRLAALYNGTAVPGDYPGVNVNLDRFLGKDLNPEKRDRFIRYVTDAFDFDEDGDDKDMAYIPDYNRVLNYAGYPPVNATTGNMTTVMETLLQRVAPDYQGSGDYQFFSARSNLYAPFEGTFYSATQGIGRTLKFTIPVIFAGACKGFFDPKSMADNNSANNKEGEELHYVGLANFLVTRILKGGQCYYNIDSVAPVTEPLAGCTTDQLGLTPNESDPFGAYQCPEQFNPPGSIAFEGLIRPPGLGGEDEEEAGIFDRVFLVE